MVTTALLTAGALIPAGLALIGALSVDWGNRGGL